MSPMILNYFKIIYKGKNAFIIQLHGNHGKSKNGLYCIGDDENELFFAFEHLNYAKKIILEVGIEYNQEVETFINIDYITYWANTREVEDVNLDELVGFNSMIILYIVYKYDGVLPKEFIGFDNDSFEKALKAFLDFDLSNKYSESKQFKSIMEDIKLIPEFEIKNLFNSPKVKNNYKILLSFFNAHIKIITNKPDYPSS